MDQELLSAIKNYRETADLGNAYKLCSNLLRSGLADEPSSSGHILDFNGECLMIALNHRELGFSPVRGLPVYCVTKPESNGTQFQYILSPHPVTDQLYGLESNAGERYAGITFSINETPETLETSLYIPSDNKNEYSRFLSECLEKYSDRVINLLNYWADFKQDSLACQLTAATYLQFLHRKETIAQADVEDRWWETEKPIIGVSGPALRNLGNQYGGVGTAFRNRMPKRLARFFDQSGFRQHILVRTPTFDFHFFDPNRPGDTLYDREEPPHVNNSYGFFLSVVANHRTGQIYYNQSFLNEHLFDGLFKNALEILFTQYMSFYPKLFTGTNIPVSDNLLWALFS